MLPPVPPYGGQGDFFAWGKASYFLRGCMDTGVEVFLLEGSELYVGKEEIFNHLAVFKTGRAVVFCNADKFHVTYIF